MKDIKFKKKLQIYELEYWNVHKNEKYGQSNGERRLEIMFNMFDVPEGVKIVADVGCGPQCGIFAKLKFPKMYAIDPLWKRYFKQKLALIPPNVNIIKSSAQDFILTEKADLIFSFNSLDHSGNLKQSIDNIISNIKPNGIFCFHIHLRTKSQLNLGHQMIVTEEDLDEILSSYKIYDKKVGRDPFLGENSNKNYQAYIACVKYKDK